MMKVLYLLRHAKSSWHNPTLSDYDRPLNKRGEKAAPLIGRYMKQLHIKPDLILCSPAKRTRETAKLLTKAAKFSTEVVYEGRLYLAEDREILQLICRHDNKLKNLLIIGHNPGLEDLLNLLTGSVDPMPTAALACILLNVKSWREVSRDSGKLVWFVSPKTLATD